MAARPLRRLAGIVAAAALVACAGAGPQRGRQQEYHRSPAPVASGEQLLVVHRGDTLYSIAFRNNLDFRQLAAWNHIGSNYLIYPGQRLHLAPPGSGAAAAEESAESSSAGPIAVEPTAADQSVTASVSGAPPIESSGAVIVPQPVPPFRALIPANPSGTAVLTGDQTTSPPQSSKAPAVAASGHGSEGSGWMWPTHGQVIRAFAPDDGSKGVDISAPLGQVVVAAAAGTVVYSGSALKGYGELVIVKHGERYLSAYGYNRRRLVEEGQFVRQGQPVGELGMGPEQQPELHFEIRDEGRPIDPLTLLPGRAG